MCAPLSRLFRHFSSSEALTSVATPQRDGACWRCLCLVADSLLLLPVPFPGLLLLLLPAKTFAS